MSIKDAFGRIDYVFANATGSGDDETPLDLFSKPNYNTVYSMVDSVNFTIHAAVPYLASSTSAPVNTSKDKPEGGPGRDRAIIITGSEASFAGYDPSPRYGVAKGAMNQITWATAAHLGLLGIRINCELDTRANMGHIGLNTQFIGLAPGWIDTPMLDDMVALGILENSDFIPMPVVTGALLRFANNSSLSGGILSCFQTVLRLLTLPCDGMPLNAGVVTRIPTRASVPFDVVAEHQVKSSLVRSLGPRTRGSTF